jgi:hypothetical protein
MKEDNDCRLHLGAYTPVQCIEDEDGDVCHGYLLLKIVSRMDEINVYYECSLCKRIV